MPFCASAGARIHFRVDGAGEPLLLIAGTAFDSSFWDETLPGLTGFRVLRLDNRGSGLTQAPDEPISIEVMTADVVAVMDAAAMPRAHVYGASMGGLIAQELAIRYPDRVLSLVLGATWAGGAPLSRAVGLLPLLASRRNSDQLIEAASSHLSERPIANVDGRFPGHALAPRRRSALRRQLSAQIRYSSVRRLHTIRQPTLVVHGANDRLVSPLNARRLARKIPGARLRLIVGAGHIYSRDEPRQSHDILLDFLIEAAGRLLEHDESLAVEADARRIHGTVLITDIVGSTEVAATLGDEAWDLVLREHDAIARDQIRQHGGTRIKGTGDGVLALFDRAGDAVACITAMQRAVAAIGLTVRAGVHTGGFLVAGDDLHGLGLHIAARIMATATSGGVRTTTATLDALEQPVDTDLLGPKQLRGIPGEWVLHELRIAD